GPADPNRLVHGRQCHVESGNQLGAGHVTGPRGPPVLSSGMAARSMKLPRGWEPYSQKPPLLDGLPLGARKHQNGDVLIRRIARSLTAAGNDDHRVGAGCFQPAPLLEPYMKVSLHTARASLHPTSGMRPGGIQTKGSM